MNTSCQEIGQAVQVPCSNGYTLLTIILDIISDSISDANGTMFVPFIMGSDKTTVTAGTGHIKYWPQYGSIGNIHNHVRRAHENGLVLIGFLTIPKSK